MVNYYYLIQNISYHMLEYKMIALTETAYNNRVFLY